MRKFYDFGPDSRPNKRESVCGYELGKFDSSVFRRCEWFQGPIPRDVQLWVKPGSPADVLGEPLSWLMLSENLIEIIKQLAPADIQEIPAPLFYVDSKKPVSRYRIVNILRSLEAIDLTKSVTSEMDILGTKILNVIEAVYRGKAIPPEVHIFRPMESMSRVVISEELAQAMTGKVVGVALIRTKTV